MAVIRTVSSITHYNMDVSEEELLVILSALRARQTQGQLRSFGNPQSYKSEQVNLIAVIEGRLKHG